MVEDPHRHPDRKLSGFATVYAALPTDEVFALVSELNDTKSGTKQVKIVKHKREFDYADRIQHARTGGNPAVGKRVRSPKAALGSSLGLVGSLPTTT